MADEKKEFLSKSSANKIPLLQPGMIHIHWLRFSPNGNISNRQNESEQSRSLLKVLLGHYLECEPLSLELTSTEEGKPHLLGSDIHFSLSHSGEYGLLGFARGAEVGVDVQKIRPQP